MNPMDLHITRIETVIPTAIMPGLVLVRVHTDAGIVGCGESYYTPHAVAAMIHDWMARRLFDRAVPFSVEGTWRFLYERAANFGTQGCELRALSAIDLALWDIMGQLTGQPIWALLGGPVRDRVPVYNSSGGPSYGARRDGHTDPQGWPGYGDVGEKGPLNDYWSIVNQPVEYAGELIASGTKALKTWIFDFAAHKPNGGLHISHADIETGLKPLRAIRERWGKSIEIILDGHGFFQLPAALRIARALREIDPLWLEDVIRPDCIDTISDFRNKAGVPVAVSEMMVGHEDYRLVLEKRAADYIMIDPTWVGGISQTRRVAQMAQAYNLPVTMHDCTGPLTLLAGVQIAAATPNVAWQETVRAHLQFVYPRLIDERLAIVEGHIALPRRPGLGAGLLPELFSPKQPDYRESRAPAPGAAKAG